MKVVAEVFRRSKVVAEVFRRCWSRPKKSGTVVSRRKEGARMVCERMSPEGQNRAGRGSSSQELEDRLMVRRAQKVRLALAVGSRVDGGAGGTC